MIGPAEEPAALIVLWSVRKADDWTSRFYCTLEIKQNVSYYKVTTTTYLPCKCREIGSSQSFTRRGTKKLLPLGCPKSIQGDRAAKTAQLILRHLKLGILLAASSLSLGGVQENFYPLAVPKPTKGIG